MQLISINKSKKLKRILAVLVVIVSIAALLAIPAVAQNTYVITDGDQVKVYTTFESNPEKVLTEAGVRLSAEDSFTTQASWSGGEITVQRAQQVTVWVNGEETQITTTGESVGDLLERMGALENGNYQVSEALDTMTYDGMELCVDYSISQTEVYTVEMPFETTYCYDPNLASGQQRILSEGVCGQVLCKAEALYVNKQEANRTILEESIVQQPVDQVIAVGTGAALSNIPDEVVIGDGYIILPTGEVLTYHRTEQFVATGYSQFNEGCDEITSTGSHVRPGVVAVDPRVIPYGTRMFIVTNDGEYVYGIGTAEDCGGSIKGNRLDLYFETDPECFQFGIRDCTVYFLGDANWR